MKEGCKYFGLATGTIDLVVSEVGRGVEGTDLMRKIRCSVFGIYSLK